MNRWATRILLVIMLLVFSMVFLTMYKQLVALQRAQQPGATSTTK